jgi:hypothetical protein
VDGVIQIPLSLTVSSEGVEKEEKVRLVGIFKLRKKDVGTLA